MFLTQPFTMHSYRASAALRRYRFSLLGLAWIVYMGFTILGYPLCGVTVMLPSILLCGVATWLYDYKMGLLTSLLSQPYNVLMMIHNLDSLAGWRSALEIGGILGQLIAVGCIAILTSTHKKISDLNLELEKRIQERTTEFNELNAFLIRQVKTEKNRLADSLYTDAASHLSTLLAECEDLHEQLSSKKLPQAEAADQLSKLARMNIKLIKNLAQELSPERLGKMGIEQAVKNMVTYFQKTVQTTFSVSISHHHSELPVETATTLYRIIHETVTNALRHGKATHIEIELRVDGVGFELVVLNNGNPIPQSVAEGTGIRLILQRAEKIDATVLYQRTSEGRTRFECASNRQ